MSETLVLEYNDIFYSNSNISGKVHITSLSLCDNVLSGLDSCTYVTGIVCQRNYSRQEVLFTK